MHQTSKESLFSTTNQVDGYEIPFLEAGCTGRKDKPEICGYQGTIGRYFYEDVTFPSLPEVKN
jgi:hypothetical protein